MIALRNGLKTRDRRLDRLPHFDERSRKFSVREVLPALTPRSYTWRCKPHLDQGPDGACFPAGVLVRMADGSQKPIEEVRTLDRVVTAEGRVGEVYATMARKADAMTVIDIGGHVSLRCTPNHPILTGRGYLAAKDLTTEDFVAITRHAAVDCGPIHTGRLARMKSRSAMSGVVNTGGIATIVSEVPEFVVRTADMGRLIGLYAAEGCTTENKVVWCFGSHESETLVPETVALIERALGAVARIQRRPNNSVNVVLYGKAWRLLFSKLVPGTSRHGDKHLSASVTHGPTEYLEAILNGWLDGDGHRRRTMVEGVTVSRRLALDMHAIATAVWLRPSLNESKPSMNRHAATRQRRYGVSIGLVGSNRSAQQGHSAVWRRVETVRTEPFSGHVFNLEVEGDHSYVADGVGVHNCVGFGVTHELAARPAEVSTVSATFAKKVIYWEAQKIDEWPGGAYPGASPIYEGTSVLSGVKVAQRLGYMKSYRWAFSFDDFVLGLGHAGPAVIGVSWWTGMMDTDAAGFIHPTGQVEGGHCILAKGVNIAQKTVTLHNSWGARWGQNGDCKVTFDDMRRLLADDGEACFFVDRVTRPKPPR